MAPRPATACGFIIIIIWFLCQGRQGVWDSKPITVQVACVHAGWGLLFLLLCCLRLHPSRCSGNTTEQGARIAQCKIRLPRRFRFGIAVSASAFTFALSLFIPSIKVTDLRTNNERLRAVSFFDHIHWPQMREAICPDMIPNPNTWTALFELAGMELGIPVDRVRKKGKVAAIGRFFTQQAGGLAFSSRDGEHHMAYLTTLKGGNFLISSNLRPIFGRWTANGLGSDWQESDIGDLFSPDRIPAARLNGTCVLTAARDPVEHFMSAYNEVEYRNAPQYMQNRPNKDKSGWKNPLPYARLNATAARFEQFVYDFVQKPGAARTRVLEINHVDSMTGILWALRGLRDRRGGNAPRLTGYLATLRNLTGEFPRLFNTCPGMPRMRPFAVDAVHPTSSDPYGFYSAAKDVWGRRDGPTCRALCALHALDYACFASIPVPDLCRKVYSDREFLDHLLSAATDNSRDPRTV